MLVENPEPEGQPMSFKIWCTIIIHTLFAKSGMGFSRHDFYFYTSQELARF